MRTRTHGLCWLVSGAVLFACSDGGGDVAGDAGAVDAAADGAIDGPDAATDATVGRADAAPVEGDGGAGAVVYRAADDGRLYRLAAVAGAAPVDLSAALDPLGPGPDAWINVSPDGRWYLIGTERFGCEGWPCVARVPATLDAVDVLETPGGERLHADFAAITSDGATVVYPEEGDARVDLFAVGRTAAGWSAPRALTADSPFAYHALPAVSEAGTAVLFACGDTPYAQERTGLCEVSTDGGGFRRLLGPTDGPGGTADSSLRAPDYADDGSIVFEADWGDGEQVWRLPAGGGAPTQVAPTQYDDNSPCALPGGRVASLWLDRPGGEGDHELKITAPDGTWFMALEGVDIADIGMGCAR